MKNKLKGLLVFGLLAVVFFAVPAFAQPDYVQGGNTADSSCNAVGAETLMYILCRASLLLNTVVPILITLGVVYFIYGIISYAIAKDEEAKTSGRQAAITGLIVLLVITSIWGLVNILRNTFGISITNTAISVPCIESPGIICP